MFQDFQREIENCWLHESLNKKGERGKILEPEESKALVDLHHNRWTEILLSVIFVHIYEHILTKQERIITGLKIEYYEEGIPEGRANTEIAVLMKIRESTLGRILYNIKNKYRHLMDARVDNKLHPEIYRAKKRKAKIHNATSRLKNS